MISNKAYQELLGWAKGKLCFKGQNTILDPSDLVNEAILKCHENKIDITSDNIKKFSKDILSNEIGRMSRLVAYDKLQTEKFSLIKQESELNQEKTCKKCKTPKPLICFLRSTHKNGYIQIHSYCKDCEREISKLCERKKRTKRDQENGIIRRPRYRSVLAIDKYGNIVHSFTQIKDALEFGFFPSNIVKCLKGQLKTYRKLKWYYTDRI